MTPHCQCALPRNGWWRALCPPGSLPSAMGCAVLAMDTSPAWMLGNLLADIGRSYNPLSYLCPGAVLRACSLMDVYQSEMRQLTSMRSMTHCRPLTRSLILSPDPARQQGRASERRYMGAMSAQSTTARPPGRRSHLARQVVLECVARRDAPQRLSLALSLLVRASGISRVSAHGAREDTPNEPAMRRPSDFREEEQRS